MIHALLRNDHSRCRGREAWQWACQTRLGQTGHPRPNPHARTAEQTIAASQPLVGPITADAACVSGFFFNSNLTALIAALPDNASSLPRGFADQAWVTTFYSLVDLRASAAAPVADRYGRRRASMAGAILFDLASVCARPRPPSSVYWLGACCRGFPAPRLPPLRRHSSRPLILVLAGLGVRHRGTVNGASMVAGHRLARSLQRCWMPRVYWINIRFASPWCC